MRAILVTGASTGIGRATTEHLCGRGHHVYATVRRQHDAEELTAELGEQVTPLLCDVTDQDAVLAAAESVASSLGSQRFAGIVNNAGVAMGGPIEYLPLAKWRTQLEVNVIGQVGVTQAFLPLIREHQGRVVFIGSIGGRVANGMLGPYAASKFALEAIAEALRLELAEWKIDVALVEPGAIKTAIWAKARNYSEELTKELGEDIGPHALERYATLIGLVSRGIEMQDKNGIDPSRVAEAIEHALFSAKPKHRYLVGRDAMVMGAVSRIMPDKARFRLQQFVADKI